MSISNWLRISSVVTTVALLSACASQLSEDELFALRYERAERIEAIREFVVSCESAGFTVVYTGPSYQKLRDPIKRPPGHAHLSDYACANNQAVDRFLRNGG